MTISTRAGSAAGISHLGIQGEDKTELAEVQERLRRAERPLLEAKGATCCYAESDKTWIADPQGVLWETFFTTYGESTVYGEASLTGLEPPAERACGPRARRGNSTMTARAPCSAAWRANQVHGLINTGPFPAHPISGKLRRPLVQPKRQMQPLRASLQWLQ